MIISREFPANYEVEVLSESPQPARLPHYYFPGASLKGGRDGILLRVTPRGAEPWIGTFAFGANSGTSGVFATADPDRFMVISHGAGYYACASDPAATEEMDVYMVLDVRPVPARGLVLLADDIFLTAYGARGRVWRTERLCVDEYVIDEVTDSFVRGTSDGVVVDCAPFEVDLNTGRHTGGLPPDWPSGSARKRMSGMQRLQSFIKRLMKR